MEVLDLEWACFESRFNQIGQHATPIDVVNQFQDLALFSIALDHLQVDRYREAVFDQILLDFCTENGQLVIIEGLYHHLGVRLVEMPGPYLEIEKVHDVSDSSAEDGAPLAATGPEYDPGAPAFSFRFVIFIQ